LRYFTAICIVVQGLTREVKSERREDEQYRS
jgi:hypothetical protein